MPYAYHTPAYKLGRWDGCVSYFTLGGASYFNLLDRILPTLVDEGYQIDIDDQRTNWNFNFTEVCETTHEGTVWPKGHPAAGEPVLLRDYQVTAINEFLKNPQCIQEIATGAGKTVMTATLSKAVEGYGRTLVIVPNKDLVKQTLEDYELLGLDVGVYFGDKKELGKTHTICTWQSLNSLQKRYKEGDSPIGLDEFGQDLVAVIVDECFDGETPVLTPSGYVPIKDIKIGDTVINYSEDTCSFKEDTVVNVHRNLTKSLKEEMLELSFDNGEIICVTANHKFLTDVGWIRADELTEEMTIISINTLNESGRIYDQKI